MRRRWLTRTALTVGLGLIAWVAISLTAQAEADDGISPAQVATDCTHAGPYQDQDVWVFDTTKQGQSDQKTAENATFEGPDGQTETVKINSQVYDLEGHSVAWLNAPAGWRLVRTNPADMRAVGTCPAEHPKEAAVSATRVKTVETLPQTGQEVGAMVTTGAALVATGVMLLFVRRKRPSPPPPRHRAGDRVWTYPS